MNKSESILKRSLNTPEVIAQGSAIIISILLAFAIEAWWDEKRDEAEHRALASSLLSEFENSHEKLKEQLETLEQASVSTRQVLELFGPDTNEKSVEEFRIAIRGSFSVGSFSYSYNSLTSLLSLKGDINFIPEQTWKLLQSWKTMINDIDVDSKHLEKNREEHFLNTLIRLEVSLLQLTQSPPMNQYDTNGHISSKFNKDLSVILRDPGAESVLAMRAIRLTILIDTYQEAISISEHIINGLKASLSYH